MLPRYRAFPYFSFIKLNAKDKENAKIVNGETTPVMDSATKPESAIRWVNKMSA